MACLASATARVMAASSERQLGGRSLDMQDRAHALAQMPHGVSSICATVTHASYAQCGMLSSPPGWQGMMQHRQAQA